MTEIVEFVNNLVWGLPTLVLILGVGLYLSIRTGFAQIRFFPKAFKGLISRLKGSDPGSGKVTSYQALCTALAATVGTGNMAGVAGAIAIGGPGSIFWMWISGLLGMVTKYAEATLAVHYRAYGKNGEPMGGPMYIIQNGLNRRYHFLAGIYCFFGVIAAFGVGNATQINAVAGSINSMIHAAGLEHTLFTDILIGIFFAVLVGLILSGGAKRIGRIAEQLVPFASAVYILLGVGVLIARYWAIPQAFRSIFEGAFSPGAVTGGIIGSVFQALRVGASRGVFTNEAGMGTAAIAHGSADVSHPAEQGLMGIMEVFWDTIVICTMTALVILCSGVSVSYGDDTGILLTAQAFSAVYGGWIRIMITMAIICFAIATILGWGLYGVRCAQFLFGYKAWKVFVWVQMLVVVLGAVLNTGTVWMLSEIVNGLMAIPNLIALAALSPKLVSLTNDFENTVSRTSATGGTYENFNKRKSVRAFSHEKVSSPRRESKQRGKKDLSPEYRSA